MMPIDRKSASAVEPRNLYSVSAQAAIAPNSSTKNHADERDDQRIHEIGPDMRGAEHLGVADQREGRRVRRGERRAEDGLARLERVHHHEQDRPERERAVGDEDDVDAERSARAD